MLEEELTENIIGGAIEVHKHLGPGLYEQIYERSLCRELQLRGLKYEQQLHCPLVYKGETVGDELKLDLWVERRVILELKVVTELIPKHDAQILSYMRLTQCRVGLLINFNVAVLKDGIKRFVL